MYGKRGRIGLVTLATDATVLPEYASVMPEDVAVYQTSILLPRGEASVAALSEMLASDQLEQAAAKLVWSDVDAIVFCCTTGSLVHGVGWDQELVGRITAASGKPASTTTTAVMEAFHALGSKSLAVATPYVAELDEIERVFLEDSGYRVTTIFGLRCGTDREICRLEPADAVALAERVDNPEADTIFISCTGLHCLTVIDEIEQRLGKPVVTSNQAGAWAALRMIGIEDAIPGFGRLLTLPAMAEATAI
jgi:maleate isomerase